MIPRKNWVRRSVYDGRTLVATINRVGNGKKFRVRDGMGRRLGIFRTIRAAMGAVGKIPRPEAALKAAAKGRVARMGDVVELDTRREPASAVEQPVADIRISPKSSMRIYGFADIEPRLVEVRWEWLPRTLHLTVDQAEAISIGLAEAVSKARANG
jgi:hypothetical protein